MIAKLPDLAVAVVFPRKRHPVGPPGQQAVVFHQHHGMPSPGMGIARQFCRPLYHLLRHVAVVTLQRPLPRLHGCLPFAAKGSFSAAGQRPGKVAPAAASPPARRGRLPAVRRMTAVISESALICVERSAACRGPQYVTSFAFFTLEAVS